MNNIDFDKIYHSNSYGDFKIIKEVERIKNRRHVLIEFISTGYRKVVRLDIALDGKVRDQYHNIDLNKVYHSNSYGDFKIIQVIGRDKSSNMIVKIKFINTGYEYDTRVDCALNGNVRDPLYNIDFNRIYQSNTSGPFKIVEYIGSVNSRRKVIVEFINTGYRKEASVDNIIRGFVRDDTLDYNIPIDTNMQNYDYFITERLKMIWKNIYSRCYNPNDSHYNNYGGIGVIMSDEWKDMNAFVESVRAVPQYDKFYNNPSRYHLDKDYLQMNIPKRNRIYSKETCIFLLDSDNINLMLIENKHNGRDSSKYYGVSKVKNLYRANIYVNKNHIHIGSFTNEIAAANAYNYWREYYHNYELVNLINDVPYMPIEEWSKYNVSNKLMCKIIDNS